jgi:hypothetical protein
MCGAPNCSVGVNRRAALSPFDALVAQAMGHASYTAADRVFWIVDNGSSHLGRRRERERRARLKDHRWSG